MAAPVRARRRRGSGDTLRRCAASSAQSSSLAGAASRSRPEVHRVPHPAAGVAGRLPGGSAHLGRRGRRAASRAAAASRSGGPCARPRATSPRRPPRRSSSQKVRRATITGSGPRWHRCRRVAVRRPAAGEPAHAAGRAGPHGQHLDHRIGERPVGQPRCRVDRGVHRLGGVEHGADPLHLGGRLVDHPVGVGDQGHRLAPQLVGHGSDPCTSRGARRSRPAGRPRRPRRRCWPPGRRSLQQS